MFLCKKFSISSPSTRNAHSISIHLPCQTLQYTLDTINLLTNNTVQNDSIHIRSCNQTNTTLASSTLYVIPASRKLCPSLILPASQIFFSEQTCVFIDSFFSVSWQPNPSILTTQSQHLHLILNHNKHTDEIQ